MNEDGVACAEKIVSASLTGSIFHTWRAHRHGVLRQSGQRVKLGKETYGWLAAAISCNECGWHSGYSCLYRETILAQMVLQ